jgi:Glyoxalase-like domain
MTASLSRRNVAKEEGDENVGRKNRLHLDFRPDDRDGAVDCLLGLGATRADVGQGEQSWIVLSDSEDNEFCILSSRAEREPDEIARPHLKFGALGTWPNACPQLLFARLAVPHYAEESVG